MHQVRCLHNINCVYWGFNTHSVRGAPVTQFIVCYVIIGELKFNPLKLCNMDIYRFFDIVPQKDDERGDFNVLQMTSGFDGDFGPVSLSISAELDSRDFDLHLHFLQTSASKPGLLFDFRSNELRYFVTHILPLFNPQNRLLDGPLPQSPAQES